MRLLRSRTRLSQLLLAATLAPALATAGCGGGSGGGTTATSTRAALDVYVTDGFHDAYKQVIATLYKIELTTDGTNWTTVYDDAAGHSLNLSSLAAAAELLSCVTVPAGTYTQARITFADHFTLVDPSGTSSSVAVDPAIGTATGSGQVAITVDTPTKALAGAASTLLIDFKLAQFQLVGGKVRPHVEAGDASGLSGIECSGHLRGTVADLVDGNRFTLAGPNGRAVSVLLTDATVVTSGQSGAAATLANGQSVLVEGTVDAATRTVTATSVTLLDDAPSERERAEGTVASVDAAAGTFVLTVDRADGVQPTGGTITVTTDSGTRFAKGRHSQGTITDVVVGAETSVSGTFDTATQTLAAKIVAVRPAK